MTPIDLFILFDEDDSGLISFVEYRKMLPMLDVHISDAKAFRYFRMCDTVIAQLSSMYTSLYGFLMVVFTYVQDGSGEIDLDEFKAALYLCDPTNGNTAGYKPSRNLTPLDAFELFDEDSSGEYTFSFSSPSFPLHCSLFLLVNKLHNERFSGRGRVLLCLRIPRAKASRHTS